MKVQFTAKAYLPNWGDIEKVASGEYMPQITPGVSDYLGQQGYNLIGTATVTVELHTADQIMAAKLDALKDQLRTVRAENQQRENAILDQISKLQAIDYTGDAE